MRIDFIVALIAAVPKIREGSCSAEDVPALFQYLSLFLLLQDSLLHLEYSLLPKTSLFSLLPVHLAYFRSHLIFPFSPGAGGSFHIIGSTWETWENYSPPSHHDPKQLNGILGTF